MNASGMKAIATGKVRELARLTFGVPASDGDGVRLTRMIGSAELDMVDPFLLLDAFESDQPGDYVGGFPDHPHRGFEAVTYLLAGRMRHKDSAGHEGVIEPGGVQWITAGRGIIHSEMPEQESGLLHGFQLWINLPAAEKMTAPAYQEFPAADIPQEIAEEIAQEITQGTPGEYHIKVIAGRTDRGTEGPIANAATEPLYLDVKLVRGATFRQQVPETHGGFVYVIEGGVRLGAEGAELPAGALGVLGPGDRIEVSCADRDSRFLVIAGKPLAEPVARGGPFVMNTREELLQAFEDYHQGQF